MAPAHDIQGIITDTGGTVFDWHTAVKQAFLDVAKSKGVSLDAGALAKTWRKVSTDRVNEGLPHNAQGRVEVNMDDVLRDTLKEVLQQYNITSLSPGDKVRLVCSWRKMRPWPDVPEGVKRLRKGLLISPFTILQTASILESSRPTQEDPRQVDWDCVISCEMIGEYKTHPITYHTATKWLGLEVENVLLTSTHNNDLKAASELGYKTAYIRREKEWDEIESPDAIPDKCCTYVAESFEDLATQLGL